MFHAQSFDSRLNVRRRVCDKSVQHAKSQWLLTAKGFSRAINPFNIQCWIGSYIFVSVEQ